MCVFFSCERKVYILILITYFTMKKNVRIVIEISEDTRTKLKVLKRGYFETYDAVILRLLKRRPND